MKIDSIGNLEWIKKYNYHIFFNFKIASDSGYYIPCTYNGVRPLKLLKTDKYGNVEWDVDVNTHPNSYYPMSLDILDSSNVIISSQFRYDLINEFYALKVTRINTKTQNVVWSKDYYIYKNLRCMTLHQSMGTDVLMDGSILVSTTAIVEKVTWMGVEDGQKAVVIKLNSNGDSLWTMYYDYGPVFHDGCQLHDILPTNDGGFVGVGFFQSYYSGETSAWLFKTDANGFVGIKNELIISNQELVIYPNPASDYITIEFSEALLQSGFIEIYNVTGIKVKRQKYKGKSSLEIDIRDFVSGLYLGKVIISNSETRSFKFVVE